MSRPRIISPDKRLHKHIELDEGDWVNLKTKLDYGESSDLYDATYRSNVGTGERNTQRVMNMGRFNIDRLLIYILAWSFTDDNDQPVSVSAETIRRLDMETANKIHDAINAIETENDRKEAETKKSPAGERPADSNGQSRPSLVPALVSTSPTEGSA